MHTNAMFTCPCVAINNGYNHIIAIANQIVLLIATIYLPFVCVVLVYVRISLLSSIFRSKQRYMIHSSPAFYMNKASILFEADLFACDFSLRLELNTAIIYKDKKIVVSRIRTFKNKAKKNNTNDGVNTWKMTGPRIPD